MIPSMPTPFESAELNLKLFELRREPVLREARAWFIRDVNPETFEELLILMRGERNASFRMVLDVGNWDASRAVNTPGQSGDPFSGHYRDLAPLWATGQYVPLLYSRAAVEAATAEAITLTPR